MAQVAPALAAYASAKTLGGADGGHAVAAAAGAAAALAFTAQNAFGYRTLDLVHSLAGGSLENFRLYNAAAGGLAAVGAAVVYDRIGSPNGSPSNGIAILAATAAAKYVCAYLGDQSKVNN